ncbi:MAG: energy-coupling factor transporter transmembrane protein EcfT [Synergistaceae bacterium]|jgi:energy-coupling factor transport system permease protein|nr:energy-coupling factor transporter transmembrane protein EcfT [Synergistaceae bacterium]
MKGFFGYNPGNSILHRLNPLTKIVISIGLCLSCFLTRSHIVILAVIAFNLLLSASAVGLKRSLKMLLSLVKFSAVLFVVQVFFVKQGNVLLRLPPGVIYITDKGVLFSLLFALRLIAAAMPLSAMLSVTRISDISNVFVRSLRIPYKYAFVITTAIRFIPLFSEEMTNIMEAQTARGVQFDTKNFLKKIRLLLPLCVPLLISSVRKIEGGAISAELRGFNLRKRTSGYKTYPFGWSDAAALAVCGLIVALTVFV